MSVDELQARRLPRPPDGAKLVRYDEYIDKQIRTTSRAVKVVDFATAIVVLVAGVLAFLLTAAVVEHWLVPGGFNVVMRCFLFGLLVAGAGYYAYRRLWPVCVWTINPVYAAQTIEHSSPSLKNSLINLLLFRQRRADISEAVYHTLEEQAAQGLTRVPIDSSVDRTQLIRFGYVLLAIVAAGALYKVFSPKDPIVAAERVLMPWVDIVPASRVSIKNVEPGAVTVTRGEFIDVSAEVLGIGENDPVQLRFTTADSRAIDKPIAMKPTNTGLRFVGRLPDAAEEAGSAGVAQNLTYRIEAGDARTLDYPVIVIAAPAILVERIDYDHPAYTGYADRTEDVAHGVPNPGHIRAIEGTRVTIHARANGPIRTAEVDFDADGRRDLEMSLTGDRAKATFDLALRDDRQTPKHLSYVLRLTNDEGRTNRDPVKYPIETLPDLSPEIAIQSPAEKSLDVRLDETVVIELEASDPDFGLSAVQLRGEAPGRSKLDVPLLEKKNARKFTGRYRFTPREHQLKAGDVVQYWVAADDIRTPKPNSTATEKRTFRIVSPDPAKQPPPDRIAQRDKRPQPSEQQQGQKGQEQQQGGQGAEGADGNQGGENGEQQQGESGGQGGESQSKNNKQQQGQGRQSDGGEGQENGEGDSADGEEGGKSDGKSQGKNANKNDGKSGVGDDPARSQGENKQSSKGNQRGGEQNQQGSSEQQPDGKQTGAGAAGGKSSQQGSQPAGTRPDQGERSKDGGGKHGGAPPSQPEPVSSEGDDDGSAFERIREHMQRSGELKEGESESPNSNERQEGAGDSNRPKTEKTADGKPKSQGESPSGDSKNQNGTEQSPASDAQPTASPDARPGAEKSKPKQEGKQDGQATQADSAEKKEPRTEDQGEGAGADTRQDDLQGRDKSPAETGEKTKSPGGQQTSTKGPSGAGEQPGENQGVPDSKEGMKSADKRQQSPSQDSKTDDKEPPAPGEGKRESDSQGDQGGDRPGGGEEGGGQKANRDGTGSAGQNQSADEGGGESSEKGAGNNSPNAGRDAKADRRTGQPGTDKQGTGSGQREGQGNKAGGKSENKPGLRDNPAHSKEETNANEQQTKENRSGEPASADGKQQNQDGTKPADGPGAPTGSGGDTGTVGGPPPVSGAAPDGDAANLEYARRQTDLVLEKLADHLNRKKVDERLLKDLGWSDEELRAFVKRWQQRKEAARNASPAADAARRELDDALRSLGLRRGALRQNNVKEDSDRNLREGYRGPVPPEYQERLRAYNQGISRARETDSE